METENSNNTIPILILSATLIMMTSCISLERKLYDRSVELIKEYMTVRIDTTQYKYQPICFSSFAQIEDKQYQKIYIIDHIYTLTRIDADWKKLEETFGENPPTKYSIRFYLNKDASFVIDESGQEELIWE